MKINTCVDIYRIFFIELMPCHSMGISKLLEEFLFLLFEAESKVSTAIIIVDGAHRTSINTLKSVITAITTFLRDVEQPSPGYSMTVDFFQHEFVWRVTSFFKHSGIAGMLDALDYGVLHMVSPLTRAFADQLGELD